MKIFQTPMLKTLSSTAGGIVLGSTLVVSSVLADDTEVFFGQPGGTGDNNPNVLFVIDTSVSMDQTDGRPKSKLNRVKEAVRDIIDQSENINVGLMRFNGRNSGGAVIYPLRNIDDRVCVDGTCEDPVAISRVGSSEADAREGIASTNVTLDDITLDLGAPASGDTIIGLHFDKLRIPQGATIVSAELSVTSSADNTSTSELVVRAEQADDASIFTGTNGDLSNRPTGTLQLYTAPNWDEDQLILAEGLESVIQEVVNRPGWCGGNALNILAEGDGVRSFYSYDKLIADGGTEGDSDPTPGASDEASGTLITGPQLKVTYTLVGMPATGGCMRATTAAQVSATADDAAEWEQNGYIYPINGTLFAPFYTTWGDIAIGMRFPELDIPQGAVIASARIDLTTRNDRLGDVDLEIYGEAIDDAPQFRNAWANRFDITNRAKTTTIDWDDVPEADQDTIVTTPDLSVALQEIINRPGWTPGNAAVFIMRNNGTVENIWNRLENRREYYSYEGAPTKGPKLIVDYQYKVDELENPGSKVRDELLAVLDEMTAADRTPTTDTYYEAVNYFMGRPVEMGRQRGDQPRRGKHRVSHPGSYTGGSVTTPPGCTEANYNSDTCKDEEITGDATYISPIKSSCQANHIVILADGDADWHTQNDEIKNNILNVYESDFATEDEYDKYCDLSYGNTQSCGRELAEHIATTDMAPWLPGDQFISTYTIGFALNSNYLKALAEKGNGSYFEAESSSELLSVFKSIFASVKAIDTTFVAPGTTVNVFNRLTNADDLYFSLFKPSQSPVWDGNLKKYKIKADPADPGKLAIVDMNDNAAVDADTGFFKNSAKSYWSDTTDGNVVKTGGAAERLGDLTTRNLYTYTGDYDDIPSGGIDLTAAGNEIHEDNSNISPALLNIASAGGTAAERAQQRETLVQWMRGLDVEDNNGDGSTTDIRPHIGDPMHSRPVIFSYESNDPANPVDTTIFVGTNEGYLHAINDVDGEELYAFMPKELLENGDKFFANQGSTRHPYGMDGGLTYWFEDTNENSFVDPKETALLFAGMRRGGDSYYALDVSERETPKLKWSIKGGQVSDLGDFRELGQTWSAPSPHTILYHGIKTKVLIFGAGYDTNQDPDSSGTMSQEQDALGRGFYIVNAFSGELLYSVLGGGSGNVKPSRMKYGVPGNIRGIDVDNDGITDQLYFGDMGGQIWRYDFRKDHNVSSQRKLVEGGRIAALADDSAASRHRRFYYEPDVALVNIEGTRKLAISIGSGWRAHPLNKVVDDRFYVLFSDDVLAAPDTYTTIHNNDLTNITNNLNPTVSENGWFLNLEGVGEKVLGNSITVNNQVIFTTYKPESVTNSCEAAIGGGAAYVVDVRNGKPVKDRNEDGLDENDRSIELSLPGIPPPGNVVITEDGAVVLVGTAELDVDLGNLTQRTFWFKPGDNKAQNLVNTPASGAGTGGAN